MWNFQGVLRIFKEGWKKVLGGRGLRFFQEGLRVFHKGLGFFGKGLKFRSSVWDCFSDGYAILGKGEFLREIEIFPGGFKFFGGVEMLSEVFGTFFGRGWDYFRGVEFVQGIWKISGEGGGNIFRVINFYIHVHGKVEAF